MIHEFFRLSTVYRKTPDLVNFLSIKRTSKWVLLLVVLAQGCGSIPPRTGLPEELADEAHIPGIPNARYWGDETPDYVEAWFDASDAEIRAGYSGIYGVEHHYLALSGGGGNGAFGAGLLVGWSDAGTRPEFTIVTGISTGALIAPFAFLGAKYDARLKEVYTIHSTKDFMEERGTLEGLQSDAMANFSGLRAALEKYIDDEMIEAIGAEYRKGRQLNIGTTNLDAKRPVIWEVGRIAASGMPNAKELIYDILMASASIPVGVPPIMINVEARGQLYDEMHVDGGTASQVFLYPLGIDWQRVQAKLAVVGTPQLYVIRNSRLEPEWETIERGVQPIAMSSIDSLIRTQGIGDMYRIYAGAQRDGLDYHLAYIPADFTEEPKEVFDPKYMKKLFEYAYNMAKQGYPWKTSPPGMDE